MEDQRKGLLLSACVSCFLLASFIRGVTGDVPEDVVYTDLHKTVRIGNSVILTCQFRGTPLAVYWKKGDDPKTTPNLVSWIPTDDVTGLCEGERPCQIMEMNEDYSLVIKKVSIAEQGRYICRVSSYRGILIHNFTDISVFSPPMEPFPIINECQLISPNNTETTCIISTSHSVEISCTASGYFPDIDLYFLHGTTSLHTINMIEVTNLDGTKNKTIYANATASEISYGCVASNIPGLQELRTKTVLVNLPKTPSPIDKTDGSIIKVVVPVIGIVTLAVICISILLLRRRRPHWGQGAKLGKENDEASEEEANINKNGTDGEQLSLDEDWFLVPREDVMQEKIGDGSAEPNKNATENVNANKQGNTPDGSDEHSRDASYETPLPATAEPDHWGQPIDNSQYMDLTAMSS